MICSLCKTNLQDAGGTEIGVDGLPMCAVCCAEKAWSAVDVLVRMGAEVFAEEECLDWIESMKKPEARKLLEAPKPAPPTRAAGHLKSRHERELDEFWRNPPPISDRQLVEACAKLGKHTDHLPVRKPILLPGEKPTEPA